MFKNHVNQRLKLMIESLGIGLYFNKRVLMLSCLKNKRLFKVVSDQGEIDVFATSCDRIRLCGVPARGYYYILPDIIINQKAGDRVWSHIDRILIGLVTSRRPWPLLGEFKLLAIS